MRARTARRLHRPARAHARPAQHRPESHPLAPEQRHVVLDCGWGRILFAHTFSSDPAELVRELMQEGRERRDLAMYVADPHVVLNYAPQDVFLDPSHTYRLQLGQMQTEDRPPEGFLIRRIQSRDDIDEVNRLYSQHGMKQANPQFLADKLGDRRRVVLVAQTTDGRIIGTVTGVDHWETFADPEQGSSLWCLAVDANQAPPGTGEALVRNLAGRFQGRGRAWMDLSVMHDNAQAIALYAKLGFRRVLGFCIKRKNPFNRTLFVGPDLREKLNPYAKIIVDEALERGIRVDVVHAENGYFTLSHGGRRIRCRESLTDLTSAVVMSRCADKALCSQLLRKAGVNTPAQMAAGDPQDNAAFLAQHGRIVVKPVDGEQGQGVSVDVRDPAAMQDAISAARRHGQVLLEEFVEGQDLRLVMIDYRVVAAAIRRPASVTGNGQHTVQELIRRQSRRRAAATDGESRIPIDEETRRCVADAGAQMDEILESGRELRVRKTANLHTGGVLTDVTDRLHPALARAAEQAARTLEIPVTGLDFIVAAADQPHYSFIEANERPGLANHDPQPTAEKFIDLLFPETIT